MSLGTPTAAVMDGRDAMLAVGMNGVALPPEHGFPVRMVVPGLYGYVSACKWIIDMELTTFAAYDAYWVHRKWSQQAPIKAESRIDTPKNGKSLTAGRVTVAGVAWAQHKGIRQVEVAVGTPGASGTSAGTRPPAPIPCRSGPPTAPATPRPRRRLAPSPTAPPAGTPSP